MSIDPAKVDALKSRLRGSLLTSTDPGYDEARAVWNGMIDRRPALILRCLGTADVIAGVTFAREQGMALSIRGGGHNTSGADRVLAAYGGNHRRLAEIKQRWDPQNLFRANKNIAPLGGGNHA